MRKGAKRLCDPVLLDAYDGLLAQLDKLEAIAELARSARREEFDARTLPGMGTLLAEIHASMRRTLVDGRRDFVKRGLRGPRAR